MATSPLIRLRLTIGSSTFVKLKAAGFNDRTLSVNLLRYYFNRFGAMLSVVHEKGGEDFKVAITFSWGSRRPHDLPMALLRDDVKAFILAQLKHFHPYLTDEDMQNVVIE